MKSISSPDGRDRHANDDLLTLREALALLEVSLDEKR
jgi:hypothetical protein